jgi:hypothetical protein
MPTYIHTYDRSYPIKYVGDVTMGYPAITEKSLNNYILPEGQVYSSTVGTGGAYLHGLYTKIRFLASQYDGHGFLTSKSQTTETLSMPNSTPMTGQLKMIVALLRLKTSSALPILSIGDYLIRVNGNPLNHSTCE